MTESYVQEIKLPNPKLKSFIREVVSKHGEILTLQELYARDQKLGNEIILGVVDSVFPLIKKRDRQLLVIRMFEVTIECHRGQLFSVYAFNKFATSLADACLRKGDFAAFCSACVCESSKYRIEKGCHHLEAHIGIPEQPTAKIFFARKTHITNAGTSKQRSSSTNCKYLGASLERHETPKTISSSPGSTETSHNSARISPVPPILSNTARMSPVPLVSSHTSRSILPCTASSRDKQIQHALDDSAVALRSAWKEYPYKKLSELLEPEKNVNIYGVIQNVVKMPREDSKHAIVRLTDETCGPDEEFQVHIFFKNETAFPKLERGCILRLHSLKTELSDGVLNGGVFRATDVVTFPPDGQGIENAFSTSKCFYLSDSDVERLGELRRWIASQEQQKPLPAVPDLCSEPIRTQLSEINKEGNYVLHCKVLNVDVLSDEIRFFTVTDGTLFTYCFNPGEVEQQATYKVRIMVLDPSPELKKIKTGALVELTDVRVQLALSPDSSVCKCPYLSFKMNGNSCFVKIFKGFESEAIKLKRQLQDSRLRDQQRPTDSVDQSMTGLICERLCQSNSDNCVQVAGTVTHSSVQSDCQQSEVTARLFNYNSYPVQQYAVSSSNKTSLQMEDKQCLPPLIPCAEEEINFRPLQKSSVEQIVTIVQKVRLKEQCVFTGNVQQAGDNVDYALLSRKNLQQDFLAGNTVNGNYVQEMAEEIHETYTEFADGVATESNAWNCTSTHSTGNQNTIAVCDMECMGDADMNEVESLASEIIPASEVNSIEFSDKFFAITQAHFRDSGISNYHEAETLVFLDDSSDALSVDDNNSHASVSRRVPRSCVPARCESYHEVSAEQDGGSSDSSVIECTDEDGMECQSAEQDGGSSYSMVVACSGEDGNMECHSAELHSSNIGSNRNLLQVNQQFICRSRREGHNLSCVTIIDNL